jgi:hypothetical protein
VNAHPGAYTTVEPDLSKGGLGIDVSKGNTSAFNNGWLLTGSGEPPTAAIAGAMANAFFDATGARLRLAPMNAANVRAALRQAGIA